MYEREILELKEQIFALQDVVKDLPALSNEKQALISVAKAFINNSPSKKRAANAAMHPEGLSSQSLAKNLFELEESIKLYDIQESQKRTILNGMDRIVKNMLKTTTVTVGT
jgi:hypothetical protein